MLLRVARQPQMLRHLIGRPHDEFAGPSDRPRDHLRPFELGEALGFRDVVNLAGRAIVCRRERDRRSDVLDEAPRRSPRRERLLEQNRRTPIVHPLQHAVKATERIARSVHHRQPQHRSGQRRVAHDLVLDRDLVVLVVDPRIELLHHPELCRRIRMQLSSQRRGFRQRNRLQRPGLEAMQHGAGAVHVRAAQRDDPSGRAAEDGHHIARLAAGAEDQVDDDVRLQRAQHAGVRRQLSAIADDLARAGYRSRASVEDRQIGRGPRRAAPQLNDVTADEAGSTDQENAHASALRSSSKHHILDRDVVDHDPARRTRPDGPAIGARVLRVFEPQLSPAAAHARQLHVHVLESVRIAGPCGHVFQVYGAREAREVFRIVLGATGPDLLGECLRQIASKDAARCQIGDAKHQTVVGLDIEERLVLGVRADVHVERHVARYGRHVEGR